MELTPLRSAPGRDNLPLEKLADSKGLSEAQKVSEVSRQFESVLLRQILGQARKTVFTSKLNDDSVSSGIYRDMVTEQLAESISKSGSFGLARGLETQLARQLSSPQNLQPKSSPAQDGTSPPLHD